ncbi:FAD/NAD(P)-binding protein [Candidatus Latescibacterota bacterium]
MDNPYIPAPVIIDDIVIENDLRDIKSFKLSFVNEGDKKNFRYLPGQFAEISILGRGESPIGIASSPTETAGLLFSVKKMGEVTTDLHNSLPGRVIGVRGPYGNTFPWEKMEGKNITIVGGGFAFTTLRSSIIYMLHKDNRKKFKNLVTIYGARNPRELLYNEELKKWEKEKEIDIYITVDEGDGGWPHREGLVTQVLEEVNPESKNSVALVCGPPVMVKFTILSLLNIGFTPSNIYVSLEMRMKCGIGKCGRCNIGSKYVCVDGPVFTYEELQGLPNEY